MRSAGVDAIHCTALQALGQRYAIPGQLSWEAYMRCAIGICGACEHQGSILCLDGPVLTVGSKAVGQ